jgi:hypothetical protein
MYSARRWLWTDNLSKNIYIMKHSPDATDTYTRFHFILALGTNLSKMNFFSLSRIVQNNPSVSRPHVKDSDWWSLTANFESNWSEVKKSMHLRVLIKKKNKDQELVMLALDSPYKYRNPSSLPILRSEM